MLSVFQNEKKNEGLSLTDSGEAREVVLTYSGGIRTILLFHGRCYAVPWFRGAHYQWTDVHNIARDFPVHPGALLLPSRIYLHLQTHKIRSELTQYNHTDPACDNHLNRIIILVFKLQLPVHQRIAFIILQRFIIVQLDGRKGFTVVAILEEVLDVDGVLGLIALSLS